MKSLSASQLQKEIKLKPRKVIQKRNRNGITKASISPVGVDRKPAGVHEHGERSSVGEVMTEEVVQQQVVGGLLGAVVTTRVDHGAMRGRILLIVIIHHGHFPHALVRILWAGMNLALLRRLVVQRVRPEGRVALG